MQTVLLISKNLRYCGVPKKGIIYVNSGFKTISNIKVSDIQGKSIAEKESVKATTSSIQNSRDYNQIVIVKVNTDDNQ